MKYWVMKTTLAVGGKGKKYYEPQKDMKGQIEKLTSHRRA